MIATPAKSAMDPNGFTPIEFLELLCLWNPWKSVAPFVPCISVYAHICTI